MKRAVLILSLVALAGCKGRARWFDGPMDLALGEAAKRETVLVVSVTARWCPSCHELERRYWNTYGGLRAGERYVLKLVDLDGDEGQRLTGRYSIISIPTTLVLDPEGHEKGRIVGFAGPREFRKELDSIAVRQETGLPELERRYAERPRDLQVALELGEAYLEAGLQKQGIEILEKVMRRDRENRSGAYMDATRLLGRYYVRCKKDHYYGMSYFKRAVEKFPDAKEAWEFRYWIGQSMWEMGQKDEALEYFAGLARDYADDPEAHATRARFLQLQCVDLDAALESIRKAMKLDPTDDWSCYVEAEVLHQMGRRDEALESLERAIEIAPEKKAIYLDRKEEWTSQNQTVSK
jgi:thioredoxin-like negative regulator of GroEL